MITPQRVGIIFTIIGTFFLAYSLKKPKTKYSGDPLMERAVEISRKEDGHVEPTENLINKKLFCAGLGCVALGSLLQW